MESSIKFNPDLESEGGKLYRQYCEEKGIDYSITAGANFCLGYMAVKPNQGPVWVKASEFKYEMSVAYHAYIGVTKGAGWFDTVEGDDIFNWSDGGDTLQCQFKDLYILDESAAGREEDNAIEFAEWLYKNRWFSFVNNKWHYTFEQGTSMSDKQYQKEYIKTTAQLYELFKQQNEK